MDNTDLRHHCYAMGYSDGEVGAFYDGYEKGRADAIDECKAIFRKYMLTKDIERLDELLEQLKEQK